MVENFRAGQVAPLVDWSGGAQRDQEDECDEEFPSGSAHYLAAVYDADGFYETVIKSSGFLELLSKR